MSKKGLSEDTIRRLAFIKYLLNVAIGQSHQPEPMAAASILTLHDSIELFLQLACEHLDVNTKTNIGFIEYWPALKPKMSGNGLTQKESMKRFNKSRVGLKHQGILPTKQATEAYRASAINFFEDNMPLVFGVDLDSISMVNLIKYGGTKERLKKADKFKENNEMEKAFVEIAIAFNQLLSDYETSKRSRFGSSPFFFGSNLEFLNSFHMGLNNYNSFDDSGLSRLSNFVDKVGESLGAMQKAIKILSFGLDYRKYTRFQLLVPSVMQTMDGKYHSNSRRSETPSIEEYDFCYNFIIESALHFQDFDFDTKSK